MGFLYIGIIMLCRIAQHLSNKKTSINVHGTLMFVHYSAFRQILSAIFAIVLIAISNKGFYITAPVFFISLFSGLMLVASMFCSIFAMKSGTMALTSMFATAGLLVPCIAGIFLFNEMMSAGQWLGVLVFFVATYFLVGSSKEIYKDFNGKTLALLIGAMLSNGAVMLAQQMFSHYVPRGDVSVFSFISFGAVGIILLLALPAVAKGTKESVERLSRPLIGYGVILSLAVFIINQLATIASSMVPPAILFTFINGGSTIIAAIVAALCFHEKLTVRSTLGIIIGVISLVMIKIL